MSSRKIVSAYDLLLARHLPLEAVIFGVMGAHMGAHEVAFGLVVVVLHLTRQQGALLPTTSARSGTLMVAAPFTPTKCGASTKARSKLCLRVMP